MSRLMFHDGASGLTPEVRGDAALRAGNADYGGGRLDLVSVPVSVGER